MIWLTVLTALIRLVPMILEMVRDGRIKDATEQEVLGAFEAEFNKRWQARVDAAVAAGPRTDGVPNDTVGATHVTPEGNDPFDRASTRRKG